MVDTPPPPPKATDWEEDFFKKHGVTEDGEKKAIRGRSTVMAYDRARQAAEQAEADKTKPPSKKAWYDKT